MLANYYQYPGTPPYPMAAQSGLGTFKASVTTFGGGSSWFWRLARAGAGYYLGGFFGHPIAGAILTGLFSSWGLLGVALWGAYGGKATAALPNRKRRRRARRSRRWS